MRVQQSKRQSVHAFMVVKRDEHHVARHALCVLHHDNCITPTGCQACIAAVFDAEFGGGIRIHLHVRRRAELVAIADLAGTGAGMKVFHHTAGVQPERVFLVRTFVVFKERQGDQPGLAIGKLEFSVCVQSL